MNKRSTVGLEIHKESIEIAFAEGTSGGEVRHYGRIGAIASSWHGWRADELTQVSVPDKRDEAIRDLVRSSTSAATRPFTEMQSDTRLAPSALTRNTHVENKKASAANA